jgi:diadenosine tetraphosphate (Ap4A) HIT family hydrolase
MPHDEWEGLLRGWKCPLCQQMNARMVPDHVDMHGRTIRQLGASVLRLCADQFTAGYCLVISTRHVAEPYELPEHEQGLFLADITRAGKAVQLALGATKMNYLILGNEQPHLHCHLIPRYYGDRAGGRPLFPGDPVPVDADTFAQRVDLIRAAL